MTIQYAFSSHPTGWRIATGAAWWHSQLAYSPSSLPYLHQKPATLQHRLMAYSRTICTDDSEEAQTTRIE